MTAERRAKQRWTLRVVCVSTALLLLNVAAPQVALADIAESLRASFSDLQWVLSGYALALAVFLLTAGSLADRFGRRRLFLTGLVLFSVASALCALAPGAPTLIAARLLQGLGAAIVFPSSLAILAEAFQGAERRRAIGVWGAIIGLAFAAGPLIGGVLVDMIGWRGVFWANVAFAIPTIAFAMRHVEESRDPDPPPVDWPGVGTLSAGLFLVVFGVLRGNEEGWTSTTVLGCLGAGALLLVAFVLIERATARPMMEMGLFANRTFTGATVLVALLAGATFGSFVYVTLFLLQAQGRDPIEAGLVLAPLALVSFASSAAAGRAAERVPLRAGLVAGMLVTAVGVLGLRAAMRPDASWLEMLPGLAVAGAGIGLANPLATFAHLGVLPPARAGLASALNNTARQIGLAIGIAVLGALLEASIRDEAGAGATAGAGAEAFANALQELLLIAVVLNLVAAAAAFVLVRQSDLWVAPPVRDERSGGVQPAGAYLAPRG
jgi:EmrB/QacA subfamily drug resistance transporter